MPSIILEDISEKAIVAGAKAGAGADDVVLVRDTAERDLSRNSTTDYRKHDERTMRSPV
jgi:microcompartment protein CcmK/EutM